MRKLLPWFGLGILVAGASSVSFACSGDDGPSGAGGSAGSLVDGSGGTAATGGVGASGGAGGTAATGGTGGSGGAKRLGRACATDAECGDGLTCVTAQSGLFGGGGPAKGYCSADCSADPAICTPFDPNAICLQFTEGGASYCLEGCSFGPSGLNQFDPNKCHGRPETACAPLFNDTGTACNNGQCAAGEICGTTNTCLTIVPACQPQCNGDVDCGSGLFCDPSDGLCKTTQKTGKPVGSTCVQDLDAAVDECKGNCIGFVHTSGQDPFTYMCAENCTLGASPSCGWAGPTSGQPAPAACLFVSTVILDNGGSGVGDRGSCGQLCNCNDDCLNPDLVCTSFGNPQLESFFQQAGYCSDPLQEDGGIDPGISCSAGGAGGTSGAGGTAGAAGAGTGGTAGSPADAGTD